VICTGRVSTSSSIQVEGSGTNPWQWKKRDSGMEQTNEYEGSARLFRESSPERRNLSAPRVSTSSSIQVEGSGTNPWQYKRDSGMEQINEYEGLARLFREPSPERGNLSAPRVSTSSSIHVKGSGTNRWQSNNPLRNARNR
jgi:hypothetical protein